MMAISHSFGSSHRRHASPSKMRLTLAFGSCCIVGILASLHAVWLAPFLALVLIAILVELPDRAWTALAHAMMTLAITIAALAAIQVAVSFAGHLDQLALPRAVGPFSSPNYLGYYAVLHVGLALAWSSRWPRMASTAGWASAISIALSGSRASLLSLAAMFILPRVRRYPIVASIAATAAIASVAVIPGHNADHRLEIWRLGLAFAIQKPWLGWGIGQIMVMRLPGFYSVPLDWTVATGIIGLVVGIWLVVEMWRSGKETRPFLIAWLVNGLFIYATLPTILPFLVAAGWLGRRRGLDVAQGAVRHDNQERRAADGHGWTESHFADLGGDGERDVVGDLLPEQAPKLRNILRAG